MYNTRDLLFLIKRIIFDEAGGEWDKVAHGGHQNEIEKFDEENSDAWGCIKILVTVVYATDIRVTDVLSDAIATTFLLRIILTCLLMKAATVSESVLFSNKIGSFHRRRLLDN